MSLLSSATAILRSDARLNVCSDKWDAPYGECQIPVKETTSGAWRGTANNLLRSLVVLLFLLLLGCSSPGKLDVSLLNASHNESFDKNLNKTIDTFSFIISNNEDFALDCSVVLQLSNGTNSSSKIGVVGFLDPKEKKSVSLHFDMFEGKTDLSIKPDCQAK